MCLFINSRSSIKPISLPALNLDKLKMCQSVTSFTVTRLNGSVLCDAQSGSDNFESAKKILKCDLALKSKLLRMGKLSILVFDKNQKLLPYQS